MTKDKAGVFKIFVSQEYERMAVWTYVKRIVAVSASETSSASTSLHNAVSQRNVIIVLVAVRTWNLTFFLFCMFLNYCNSYIRLFTIGLYYSQISNTTATFYCRLSKHSKQLPHWSTFLQQLRHSTCFTRDSSSRTVSGWLQHTTQNRTPSSISRCSLTLDHKTALHSPLYSLLVQTPPPWSPTPAVSLSPVLHASLHQHYNHWHSVTQNWLDTFWVN
jgi:hypothetical protein